MISLERSVRQIMNTAWQEQGFCVPNSTTYPFQWLWDSCFHSLIWNRLGSERDVAELTSALAHQHRSGFVPHVTYWAKPDHHAGFWGQPMVSTITQPPMYGHVVATLVRDGRPVTSELVTKAVAGVRHLLFERPRTDSGMVPIFHPWETGCDDSPRWDSWLDKGLADRVADWRVKKGAFVEALTFGDSAGVPLGSPVFSVGSVGFNALLAWNTNELLSVLDGGAAGSKYSAAVSKGGAVELQVGAEELVETVRSRWSAELQTWTDDGPLSGQIKTADAALALLVDPRPEVFAQLVDPLAFGADHGPAGVHRQETSYEPDTYWRGPTWPQLSYLLWRAAVDGGQGEVVDQIGRSLVAGAVESNFAEYWNPDTGNGLGAVPQTWAGLALLVS